MHGYTGIIIAYNILCHVGNFSVLLNVCVSVKTSVSTVELMEIISSNRGGGVSCAWTDVCMFDEGRTLRTWRWAQKRLHNLCLDFVNGHKELKQFFEELVKIFVAEN